MGKGSTARFRISGRIGARDCPPELRETLRRFLQNPRLLDGLPPHEREAREGQLRAYQASREMRRAAAIQGHRTRHEREAERLIDRLTDTETDADMEAMWAGRRGLSRSGCGSSRPRSMAAEDFARLGAEASASARRRQAAKIRVLEVHSHAAFRRGSVSSALVPKKQSEASQLVAPIETPRPATKARVV
jgi:hypothetical protein